MEEPTLYKTEITGPHARKYIVEQLSLISDVLFWKLHEKIRSGGKIYTFLPIDFKLPTGVNFDDALPRSDEIRVGSNRGHLIAYIQEHLDKSDNNISLLLSFHRQADQARRYAAPHVYRRDYGYFYLDYSSKTANSISDAVKWRAAYPSIGNLATIAKGSLNAEGTVSDEVVDQIVESTTSVFVGAFDEVGFLLWEN